MAYPRGPGLGRLRGQSDPREAGIGPWHGDDRLGDWDGIITYALDRLFRKQADYVLFYSDYWEAHGKIIISAGASTDTSSDVGRFVAGILVMCAEMERGRMIVRRRDAQNKCSSGLVLSADRALPVRRRSRCRVRPLPAQQRPLQPG